MSFIRNLYNKYQMQVRYLIFGIATTMISITSYYLLYKVCRIPNVFSNIFSWFFAVLFAYITNKIWVFESKSRKLSVIAREAASFFLCRVSTGVLEVFLMWLFIDVLSFNPMIMKAGTSLLVIILNYVVSRLLVFRKKSDTKSQGGNYEQAASQHHSSVL